MKRLLYLLILLATGVLSACQSTPETYDLVILGGRVIDPETGLDAVRNVGIRQGTIEAVTEESLAGARVVEADGLVVAPGFIDLHEHGQHLEAYHAMVQDGVTSALELEVGTEDVDGWYREREGGQPVNYGVSIGHIRVRMDIMDDPGEFLPSGPGGHQPATPEQIEEMASRIAEGLEQGAVAVGFGLAYTPAASAEEFEALLRVAAEHGASAHIHVREGPEGATEAIEAAAKTGTALHIVHANSTGGPETVEFLRRIEQARASGQDVTTEAYPYEAGMTSIQSAFFDDWREWEDEEFAKFQWVETGARLDRESFEQYRKEGGNIILHERTEQMTRDAIGHPLTMVASDGFLVDGKGHPRTAGTYSRVLGKYVREEGLLSLMDALRKMTIEPARRLQPRVEAMARKGRIQEGADADITIFDPETVRDRATYEDSTLPSEGIHYVLVNGEFVVDGGELIVEAFPGRPIRAGTSRP